MKTNNRRTLITFVLRDYAHYVRWSNGRLKDFSGWGYPSPRSPRDFEGAKQVIADRREELKRKAPIEFPCVAVIQCVSCSYEESEPFYLFGSDLQQLITALGLVAKARR
jgi:hypothetical protein